MIQRLIFTCIITTLLFSCSSNKATIPNTDIDVATAFIKNVLINNLKEADNLILKDELNKEYFDLFKKKYEAFGKTELENYKNADIIINSMEPVSDSITIINYSTSYKRESKNKVKMVRVNGQWQVDFKYTFSGNL